MAKKAATKPAAKRKPRAKKPVQPAIELSEKDVVKPIAWRSWGLVTLKAVALIVAGAVAGVWGSGGIDIGPGPSPHRSDVLAKAYDADRVTQVAVLRDLAKQPFDGTADEGRKQAGEWFNAQRFRNRANDFGGYTDRVAEAIAANSEDSLATELEAK